MYIHKNGIKLRKIESSDLPNLAYLKNESWFGTHTTSFVNADDQLKWFQNINNHKIMIFIAIDSITSEQVGLYKIQNIDWISRRYDSAHDVFQEARGKGYSKKVLEAGVDFGFEVLNMNRLDTEVLENNIASLKSAMWVGYIEEGRRRSCIYKCNQYLDSICLGLLRDEWLKLPRVQEYQGICNISYTPKNNPEK